MEILPVTDAIKTFGATSRYKHTSIYKNPDDGQYYYGIWAIPEIDEQPQDTYYTVKATEERRLDKIAQLIYGNYLLWWPIAVANSISDPFAELSVGQIIRIPYLPYIYSKVLA
jgi:hypothetical protein